MRHHLFYLDAFISAALKILPHSVSVIVPCHRVIGAKGNLTGYAGGIERKAELLKIEQNQNATEQYPF